MTSPQHPPCSPCPAARLSWRYCLRTLLLTLPTAARPSRSDQPSTRTLLTLLTVLPMLTLSCCQAELAVLSYTASTSRARPSREDLLLPLPPFLTLLPEHNPSPYSLNAFLWSVTPQAELAVLPAADVYVCRAIVQ